MQQARHLETVRLTPTDNTYQVGQVSPSGDAYRFETYHRPWPEREVDWERLRGVGRLPLFGVSYIALILIPIIFYGLAIYNDKVELVRTWAEQVAALPDHPLHRLALPVLKRLHPRPIPSQSFWLLLSTVRLAAGSTLYTFFCPSRIKEFSHDQWCDQLGRSLLHYWAFAWKHRYIRLACAACYVLGGRHRPLGDRHEGVADWPVHREAPDIAVAMAVISQPRGGSHQGASTNPHH
jgi:hypothetical protein